jgi:hypothetical protein
MAGEWIPLQSSLVAAPLFFAIGGFNVQIPSSEDIDLLRRLTLVADVASTDAVVAFVGMGVDNSTTDHANRDKLARIGRVAGVERAVGSNLHNFGSVERQAGELERMLRPQRYGPGSRRHGRLSAAAC